MKQTKQYRITYNLVQKHETTVEAESPEEAILVAMGCSENPFGEAGKPYIGQIAIDSDDDGTHVAVKDCHESGPGFALNTLLGQINP